MVKQTFRMCVSKEFKKMTIEMKNEFIKRGIKPPSNRIITEIVAKKLKKEGVLIDKFMRIK